MKSLRLIVENRMLKRLRKSAPSAVDVEILAESERWGRFWVVVETHWVEDKGAKAHWGLVFLNLVQLKLQSRTECVGRRQTLGTACRLRPDGQDGSDT